MTDQVVITSAPLCTVEVQPPAQASIEVGMTTIGLRGPQGIQGPQGIPGPNEIGGFPVAVADAKENDTLLLKSWAWQNTPQEALTDGGNF
jgi:hypothetical protein